MCTYEDATFFFFSFAANLRRRPVTSAGLEYKDESRDLGWVAPSPFVEASTPERDNFFFFFCYTVKFFLVDILVAFSLKGVHDPDDCQNLVNYRLEQDCAFACHRDCPYSCTLQRFNRKSLNSSAKLAAKLRLTTGLPCTIDVGE